MAILFFAEKRGVIQILRRFLRGPFSRIETIYKRAFYIESFRQTITNIS
jgi:hypothetical protein